MVKGKSQRLFERRGVMPFHQRHRGRDAVWTTTNDADPQALLVGFGRYYLHCINLNIF